MSSSSSVSASSALMLVHLIHSQMPRSAVPIAGCCFNVPFHVKSIFLVIVGTAYSVVRMLRNVRSYFGERTGARPEAAKYICLAVHDRKFICGSSVPCPAFFDSSARRNWLTSACCRMCIKVNGFFPQVSPTFPLRVVFSLPPRNSIAVAVADDCLGCLSL